MNRTLVLLAVFAAFAAFSTTGSTLAAAPPDHALPAKAEELALPNKPVEAEFLPNEGTVISATDASEFTYIEVDHAGAIEWLAAPLMTLKPGSTIRYEEGSPMTNFYSKLLQRTFPKIIFVGRVIVTAP